MHTIKTALSHWGPVIFKCVMVAVLAGLALGIGSGLLIENWKQINLPQLSLVLGASLWLTSMIFAVYVTQSLNKRRFKKFACIMVHSQSEDAKRREAVNHNRRYMA
jgi:hypothetical protein